MRNTLAFILFMGLSISLFATNIKVDSAKLIAQNHYVIHHQYTYNKTIDPPLVVDIQFIERDNDTLMYVFNFENGFAIVSVTDEIIPVLGFSLLGSFKSSNLPPALQNLIDYYMDQISFVLKQRIESSEDIKKLWSHYYSGSSTTKESNCEIWPKYFGVNPLITTEWGQGCFYNSQCPTDTLSGIGYCEHVPNGCVALAMAQVIKFWNYPSSGSGSHGYYDGSYLPNYYGYQFANFENTTYNWNSMPNILTGDDTPIEAKSTSIEVYAVSNLIYHCGISVDMDYGYNGSGAYLEDVKYALPTYFNYSSNIEYCEKNDYSESNWEAILRSNLDNHRPIPYRGSSSLFGGHAFVLDGYSKIQYETCTYSALFHINWGWNGCSNGYFYLSNLSPGNINGNFNLNQAAIVSVYPPNLTYSPPNIPGQISDPACTPHCRDVEVEYCVSRVENATSYEWDIEGNQFAHVSGNNRYARVWSHHEGSATLKCRALNHGVPGPWRTKTIYIEDCNKNIASINDSSYESPDISIFPNPSHDQINISSKIPKNEKFTIYIVNSHGTVIDSHETNTLNIEIRTKDYPSGLYIIKCVSSNNILCEKIIINNQTR